MKADFTFKEMEVNGGALIGRQLWHKDELVTIDYIKIVEGTKQYKVHCTNGDVFMANTNKIYTWEVNNENVSKPVTKEKLKRKK